MKPKRGIATFGVVLCGAAIGCGQLFISNPLNVFAFFMFVVCFLSMTMCACTYAILAFFERLYGNE